MSDIDLLFTPLVKKRKYRQASFQRFAFWKDSFYNLWQNKLAMFGFFSLLILIFGAIFIPFFTTYPYYETHLHLKNTPPSAEFWFGTDELGRSMFSRIWYGARISLFVGITAALLDMVIGVLYGAIAGFAGGKVDEVMMRITDIFHSIPNLLITILLMVLLGQGILTIIVALALTGWITMARIIRSQILQLKEQEFITAAVAVGASKSRIIMRHLIPNTVGAVITTVTLTIPSAIFTEGFLSFLGLGVQPPLASWGTMASDGLSALAFFPWRLFFPAGFISFTMLAFNFLGDGLRDAFDPRMRE